MMYVVYLYYKRKKKFFYKFFLFCIFLETSFLGIKNQFSPFFLRHFKSDPAEIFFGEASSDLGWVFFFFFMPSTNQV